MVYWVWIEEGLRPVGDPARQSQEPETVAPCEVRPLALALENSELVAQEGIFGEQFGFAAREILQGSQQDRRLGGSHPASEGVVHAGKTTLPEFVKERVEKTHKRFIQGKRSEVPSVSSIGDVKVFGMGRVVLEKGARAGGEVLAGRKSGQSTGGYG